MTRSIKGLVQPFEEEMVAPGRAAGVRVGGRGQVW